MLTTNLVSKLNLVLPLAELDQAVAEMGAAMNNEELDMTEEEFAAWFTEWVAAVR